MNRRLDVALVVAVAPISPASAADVETEVLGEILIEVGHSADVYGVTNNYGAGPERRLSRVFVAHTD